jgi:predicted MPP superfamily phosphohydrolase
MYVNRGLGMDGRFGPKIRFLSRPEIAVFDIRGI